MWTELSLSCLRAASPDEKLACEICDDAISVALAGSLAPSLPLSRALRQIVKTTRVTCTRTDRRTGSSSVMGFHDVIS